MNTDNFTTVTINDRKFSIKKFDAKTGLKMARLLLSKVMPLISMIKDDDNQSETDAVKSLVKGLKKKMTPEDETELFSAAAVLLDNLDDNTIDYIVDKCLMHCYEQLPAGSQPVLFQSGVYGVEGIEDSMSMTVRLCYEAIKWGASDFFDEKNSALSQLLKGFGKQSNQ